QGQDELRVREQEAEVRLELVAMSMDERELRVADVEERRSLRPSATQALEPVEDRRIVVRGERGEPEAILDVAGGKGDGALLGGGDEGADPGQPQGANDVVGAGPTPARHDHGRSRAPGSGRPRGHSGSGSRAEENRRTYVRPTRCSTPQR